MNTAKFNTKQAKKTIMLVSQELQTLHPSSRAVYIWIVGVAQSSSVSFLWTAAVVFQWKCSTKCHQSSGSGSHQAGTTNPRMREQKADFAEAWNLWGSFKGTTRLTGLNLAAEVCVSGTQYINQQYSACTLKNTSVDRSLFVIYSAVLLKFK